MIDITPQEFLNTIFDDVPDDEVVLVSQAYTKNDGSNGYANTSHDSHKLKRWLKKGASLYFNISTVRKSNYIRRRKQDCGATYCIVLDDIGTKVNEPPVTPSWKLETSMGSFQWGYIIDPTEELDDVTRLTKALAKAELTDGGATGYNRLMRIPGSVNTKHGKGKWVSRLTHWDPDRVFGSIEEMAELFGVSLEDAVPTPTLSDLSPLEVSPDVVIDDPLFNWLMDQGLVVKQDGEWFDIICPNHEEHTDQSQLTGRYSPLGYGDNINFKVARSFSCFHEHCSDLDTKKFIEDMRMRGAPEVFAYDPLPVFQSAYMLVANGQRVCNSECVIYGDIMHDVSLNDFGVQWQHIRVPIRRADNSVSYISLKKAFADSSETTRVRDYIVKPRRPNGLPHIDFINAHNETYLNTYVPPYHLARPNYLDVFLDHIEYLIPIEEERETFLNWLAFKLQRPETRSYGVVMVTEEFGVGRSWVANLLREVWGQRLVSSINIGELTGHGSSAAYNDWMSGTQLVVVEEALDSDNTRNYKAYEHIKTIVDTSPGKVVVNTKYGSKREEMIYFNLLVLSNHMDALTLPDGDRRFMIIENPNEARDKDYYTRLFDCLNTNTKELAAAVYEYLLKRDVSKFNPAHPPLTDAKEEMIEESRPPSDRWAIRVSENAGGELITKPILEKLVKEAARLEGDEPNPRAIRMAVRKLWRGAGTLADNKNGYRHRIDKDKRESVRALRRHDYWYENINSQYSNAERHVLVESELKLASSGLSRNVHNKDGTLQFK